MAHSSRPAALQTGSAAPIPAGARPEESRLEPRAMGEAPDPSPDPGPGGLGQRGRDWGDSPEATFLSLAPPLREANPPSSQAV